MRLIDYDKLKQSIMNKISNLRESKNVQEEVYADYIQTHVNDYLEEADTAFEIDMVLEQLTDYGKYKGILRLEDDKCENYIPVSVAKQIVKGRGLGGILGYMNEENTGYAYEVNKEDSQRIINSPGIDDDFIEECKRVAKKYQNKAIVRDCSTCKNNVEFPPPHSCDVCTSLDQEEEYSMWEAK